MIRCRKKSFVWHRNSLGWLWFRWESWKLFIYESKHFPYRCIFRITAGLLCLKFLSIKATKNSECWSVLHMLPSVLNKIAILCFWKTVPVLKNFIPACLIFFHCLCCVDHIFVVSKLQQHVWKEWFKIYAKWTSNPQVKVSSLVKVNANFATDVNS